MTIWSSLDSMTGAVDDDGPTDYDLEVEMREFEQLEQDRAVARCIAPPLSPIEWVPARVRRRYFRGDELAAQEALAPSGRVVVINNDARGAATPGRPDHRS